MLGKQADFVHILIIISIYLPIGSKDICEAKQSELDDEDSGMESEITKKQEGKQEGKENVAPSDPPKKRRRKRIPKV